MLVMNKKGEIFDERRKNQRRKEEIESIGEERRVKDRRKEDINKPKKADNK